MMSQPVREEPRQAAAPILTQESSAQPKLRNERRLSEEDMEYLSNRYAASRIPEETVIEARQNGTTGHANILHFSPPTMAPVITETRRTTPLSEPKELPQVVEKTPRPAPKPRKAAAKKDVTPDLLSGSGTKPPRVGVNIEWVQKGVGWDCREVYYVGKQRRRRHLGHIGRQKWEEMQQQYSGAALEEVLREWIEARRAEKSMSLGGE